MSGSTTYLVTGGTGSFGRMFVASCLTDRKTKRVIVYSRDESKQHEMQQQFDDARVTYFIGDVRDKDRLARAFQADVDVVVHAAAMKQAAACENNPFEAVATNVIGAKNVIDAALDCGVPKVIAMSTDKVVHPLNSYGATKLCAERLFVQGNSPASRNLTHFSCVRYCDAVSSCASVIPTFLRQLETGELTVSDEHVTRFWITLDQSVKFAHTAIARMHGGEIFVPRIPSMGLLDLARAIAPQAKITVAGIRPGENLHECLISASEARHTVALKDMFVIKPEFPWWDVAGWSEGDVLPSGFEFSSDKNERWLTAAELAIVLATAEHEAQSHFRRKHDFKLNTTKNISLGAA